MDFSSIEVLCFSAFVRSSGEYWIGTGVWVRPTNPHDWDTLVHKVTCAIHNSMKELVTFNERWSVKITCHPVTLRGMQAAKMRNVLKGFFDDSPERMEWLCVQKEVWQLAKGEACG